MGIARDFIEAVADGDVGTFAVLHGWEDDVRGGQVSYYQAIAARVLAALPDDGRCKTCRWWEGISPYCTRELYQHDQPDSATVGRAGPDFGCVHYAPKEPSKPEPTLGQTIAERLRKYADELEKG